MAARVEHAAAFMANGKILLAGGCMIPRGPAELYNPVTDAFEQTHGVTAGGCGRTATWLSTGRVLLFGGDGPPELYDPTFQVFDLVESPTSLRNFHTATMLADGRVLLAGGVTGISISQIAEIYDPTTGKITRVADMITPRFRHAAALQPDGTVLISGGLHGMDGTAPLATAEIYDPTRDRFTSVGSMGFSRAFHTATPLPTGKTLIVGYSAVSELYDPGTRTFTTIGETAVAYFLHTATYLPNDKVLIVGAVSELYDIVTGTFSPAGQLRQPRFGHSATLLPGGLVLIAGGLPSREATTPVASAELYATIAPVALALQNGRFRLELVANNPRTNRLAPGVPMPRNEMFGMFSLPLLTNDDLNPELVVKIVGPLPDSGKFLLFYASLTDFELTLTVTDTVTGKVRRYFKPGLAFRGFSYRRGTVRDPDCGMNCLTFPGEAFRMSALRGERIFQGVPMADLTDSFRTGHYGFFALPAMTGSVSNPEVVVKVASIFSGPLSGTDILFWGTLTDAEVTLLFANSAGEIHEIKKPAGEFEGDVLD